MIIPEGSKRESTSGNGPSFPVVPFASCFAYLPNGRGPVCREGRSLCAYLKSADPAWIPRLTAQVWLEATGHGRFALVFGGRAVLVPVPRSMPGQHAQWVGEHLAWCLKQLGLAAEVWPILRRRYAVRKSAYAASGERPSVLEHYASLAVERALSGVVLSSQSEAVCKPRGNEMRLTLIDDVVTRGRTLLAAAGRLREAFPQAEIRAFALLRTLGPDETLRQILDPCEGEIRWILDDARRRP